MTLCTMDTGFATVYLGAGSIDVFATNVNELDIPFDKSRITHYVARGLVNHGPLWYTPMGLACKKMSEELKTVKEMCHSETLAQKIEKTETDLNKKVTNLTTALAEKDQQIADLRRIIEQLQKTLLSNNIFASE